MKKKFGDINWEYLYEDIVGVEMVAEILFLGGAFLKLCGEFQLIDDARYKENKI